MTLPDSELLELDSLCSAVVDDVLDTAGRARLSELLAGSEEARRHYVRVLGLSASLCDYAGELQLEPAEPVRRLVSVASWRWGLGSLAAAAALVLGALFFFAPHPVATDPKLATAPAGEEQAYVATLSALTDGKWTGFAPALGDEIRRGQQLQLASGLAEITFHSGAQLVVEGPAVVDLASAWEAVLRQGSLRANVPAEAIGFRVTNSDVEVIDLGTEFSMVATAQGGTEVFVLKGAVEAGAPGDGRPVTLREHQARRFDRARVTEVRDPEQKLKRWAAKSRLVQFTRPAGYLHWSFDEAGGPLILAQGTSRGSDGAEARIISTAAPGAWRAEGHFQQALVLDGATYATATIPRMAKRASATVAFWVRVPADAELDQAGPMIALEHGPSGMGASISWNRDPGQGVLGALRTELEDAPLVGVTSLRDGRWHHVALVLGASGKTRQYVDGRLEAATPKRPKRLKEDRPGKNSPPSTEAAELLVIGRGFPLDSTASGSFHGMIDELFVADRALTSAEIRQLERENQITRATAIAAAPALQGEGAQAPASALQTRAE